MLNILCACTHPEILEVMNRLVSNHDGWLSSKAASMARLQEMLENQPYDVVLLGAGFGTEERANIEQQIATANQKTKVVTHYGGGSGLLFAEINMAMEK